MCRKNLRLLVCAPMIAFLLFTGACTSGQDVQDANGDIPENTEVEMDPSIVHDAQMIIDAFSLPEYYEENAVWSVGVLRNHEVGPFASLRVIDEVDLYDHERAGHFDYMTEIIDDSGACYRVGFNKSGWVVLFYPPDGLGTVIYHNFEIA